MKTSLVLSLLAVCGLGTASLGAATAASAATPDSDAPSVTVHYADLNLATDSGTRELYRRLRSAAYLVCPNDSARDLAQSMAVANCRSDAIARAVKKINNARLVEIAANRTHAG